MKQKGFTVNKSIEDFTLCELHGCTEFDRVKVIFMPSINSEIFWNSFTIVYIHFIFIWAVIIIRINSIRFRFTIIDSDSPLLIPIHHYWFRFTIIRFRVIFIWSRVTIYSIPSHHLSIPSHFYPYYKLFYFSNKLVKKIGFFWK
jgi:hypothetical protein